MKAGICLASIHSLCEPKKYPAERERVASRRQTCLALLLSSQRLYEIALPIFLSSTDFRFTLLASANSGFNSTGLNEDDARTINLLWPNINRIQQISSTRLGLVFLANNTFIEPVFTNLRHIESDTLTATPDTYGRSHQAMVMHAVRSFMNRNISVRIRYWYTIPGRGGNMYGPVSSCQVNVTVVLTSRAAHVVLQRKSVYR